MDDQSFKKALRLLRDSASLRPVVMAAEAQARASQTRTYLAHLADAMLDDPDVVKRVASEVRVKAKAGLAEQASSFPECPDGTPGGFAFDLVRLVSAAGELSRDCGASEIGPLLLLATCLSSEPLGDAHSTRTQETLRAAGLTLEGLLRLPQSSQAFRGDFQFEILGFGRDLTAMARAGAWKESPVIGMQAELQRLAALVSSTRVSPVIVGAAGVGKSVLVRGLAYHIARATRPLVPPRLDSWTIVQISPDDIVQGTQHRGKLEERIAKVRKVFRENPTVVPFFDEIHRFLDSRQENTHAHQFLEALKPEMAEGLFRCIGATTDDEYDRFIGRDEAMNRRFTKVPLAEPDASAASAIIAGSMGRLLDGPPAECGVTVAPRAIEAAVRITRTHDQTEKLPAKAIRLLEEVISEKTYEIQIGQTDHVVVTADDVARKYSALRRLPLDTLQGDSLEFYDRLRTRLEQEVFGQEQALEQVLSHLKLHARGWTQPNRPKGRFLFVGPPGVGKKELALRLASGLGLDQEAVIIKNMGDYGSETARNRFMGSDPGFVGFGETSTVYSRVRARPSSLIVLEDLDRAHPDLSGPLLSVLDGFAEDGAGRSVSFSQCLFVLTTTDHSSVATQRHDGLTGAQIWQPELMERIDEVVVFTPLSEFTLHKILDAMIAKRGASAGSALPTAIDQPAAHDQIVAWATEAGGASSARGLETALLRWLKEHA